MHRRIARLAPLLGFSLLVSTAALAQDASQWGYYSGNSATMRYSPLAQIDRTNVRNLKIAWRHPHADPAIVAEDPDLTFSNRYMSTPIYVDGLLYVPNAFGLVEALDPKTGKARVDAETSDRGAGRPAGTDDQQGRRVLGPRRRRADSDRAPAAAIRAEPEDGRAHRRFRRRRQGRALDGAVSLQVGRRARRRRRRRAHRRVDARAGFRRVQGWAARPRARIRRAHRQATLELQPDSARRGRSRSGHVEGRLPGSTPARAIHGRRSASTRRSDSSTCRPRRDERHVRRRPHRRQPVHELGRRARHEDRPAQVALPDRASRPLRLRLARGADPRRHHRRRQDRSRRSRS